MRGKSGFNTAGSDVPVAAVDEVVVVLGGTTHALLEMALELGVVVVAAVVVVLAQIQYL